MRAPRIVGATVLLGASLLVGTAGTADAAAPVRCHGHPVTLLGTSGDDVLQGTSGRDVIVGLAGDDVLVGNGGDDLICGGHGSDGLIGGPGDDLLGTGPGLRDQVSWDDADRAVHVDLVRGVARGEGRDRVLLGAGVVHLTAYDDTFVGTGFAEEVHAGDGDDTLRSGPGDDILHLDTDESTGDDDAVAGRGDDEIAAWAATTGCSARPAATTSTH